MLRIVGKQPAFEALVHHGGRNCKMQRGRTAVSERFRIQLPFNGFCVIDDLQARAGGESAEIAADAVAWRMMQKFRGYPFTDFRQHRGRAAGADRQATDWWAIRL